MAVPVKDLIKLFENPIEPNFMKEKNIPIQNNNNHDDMEDIIQASSKDFVRELDKCQKDPNIAIKNSLKQIAENILRKRKK